MCSLISDHLTVPIKLVHLRKTDQKHTSSFYVYTNKMIENPGSEAVKLKNFLEESPHDLSPHDFSPKAYKINFTTKFEWSKLPPQKKLQTIHKNEDVLRNTTTLMIPATNVKIFTDSILERDCANLNLPNNTDGKLLYSDAWEKWFHDNDFKKAHSIERLFQDSNNPKIIFIVLQKDIYRLCDFLWNTLPDDPSFSALCYGNLPDPASYPAAILAHGSNQRFLQRSKLTSSFTDKAKPPPPIANENNFPSLSGTTPSQPTPKNTAWPNNPFMSKTTDDVIRINEIMSNLQSRLNNNLIHNMLLDL